ncbi:MAG: 50S ribosomal protein L25/general stress protein Ctc [Hyphomicrobiales bacterium]|nr:50S ribosomal protein L25/general stress protein Ctc [Hyphomicrobiales bacterium]
MSASYELNAETRAGVGKGAARAVRREGRIPAVIYGDKKPPIPITLSYKEINERIHAGGFLTTVANIVVDGKKIRVIPRDFQLDPVRDFPMHVDFLRIAAGARITVNIPVHFVNEDASPGIKRGGVLNVVRHEIEVDCPADAIPDAFEADLTGLDIGDSLHISEMTLPEGVNPTISDRDFTVATIASSAGAREEAQAEAEEGMEEVEADEVPVVGEEEE